MMAKLFWIPDQVRNDNTGDTETYAYSVIMQVLYIVSRSIIYPACQHQENALLCRYSFIRINFEIKDVIFS